MPTVEQYAATIVEKYHVDADSGSPAHRAADEIIPLVKQWGKQYLLGMTLSGAYAKNTAITLSSHADLLIALSPVPNMDMRKIFWSLFEFLSDHNLRTHTRDVSVQVECKKLLIDLIPSCRDDSGGNLLFNKKIDDAVSSSVTEHVHLIANSGRQQEICALKIWRARQKLDFPSLYLELTVLQALAEERFGQLADNILTVLRYIASRFEQAVVRDPANAKNIVSADISESGRQAIAKAAREAVYDENWKKIIW